jgi:hypothetical protein
LLARFLAIKIFAPSKKIHAAPTLPGIAKPKNKNRPIRASPRLQS